MIRVLQGDVRKRLAELPSDSFDCIVTSPPYWGLRDYGVAGQIGLEPTLTEYLDTMVAVCRDLRRVLKPSGVFFLNIGDAYAGSWGAQSREHAGKHAPNVSMLSANQIKAAQIRTGTGSVSRTGLKPKDLMMIPNRLAILLQADGWWVRSEIIWHKPSPMPESVTDRCTSAHEKIWMLTKSANYWYDAEAIAETAAPETAARYAAGYKEWGKGQFLGSPTDTRGPKTITAEQLDGRAETRNARNVWTIATQSYSGAHFATFPPALAERCIKAGCPEGGAVLDPFGGAGTTAMVADRLGRDCTLIELNADYVELIKNRIQKDAGMFAQLEAVT